jgi:hypothetical protein
MEYSGRKQIKIFYDYIYSDETDLYIDRKKEKFEKVINCANEE